MSKVKRLPPRSKVKEQDTWDLSSLYSDDDAWRKDLAELKKQVQGYEKFKGTLGDGADAIAKYYEFDLKVDRIAERLGVYAFLRTTEDQAAADPQTMMAEYRSVAARLSEAASFVRPELLSISANELKKLLADKKLAKYKLSLERLVRYKPYTLGEGEEKLIAMQAEMSQASGRAFRQLVDADLKFGDLEDETGSRKELSNATLMSFLVSPQRSVREAAFHQYYEQYIGHENTLAATLAGSIHSDVYYARARGYDSALHSALYSDNLPGSVYDQLIESVRRFLPSLHRYYEVRRRKMKLRKIHHYDTYVPILSDLESKYTWEQATKTILDALEPLGSDYCQVLEGGLNGRWCDRYPNRGKQSGAFSYGSYDGDPYIMMNYQPTVLSDVFTLAHEAGHSMHSYYSAKHQPFLYYNYTIFVAEVASTFNEELLSHHLLSKTDDRKWRAYLINREIDDIRGTIFRQTMFAEFEKMTHEMAEAGEPLTLQSFKDVYRGLLEAYFGTEFVLDDCLSLECLRIPHFYRAFYVFKYATGLSAAIALSQRVLHGGDQELADYLGFLSGGCSKYPLDLLRDAGVDMTQPEPVNTALEYFDSLVDELDELL